MRGLAASGASVLVVEQRARAALAISDRTYVLAGGEVRMEGTPAGLLTSSAFVESFLGGTVTRLSSRQGNGHRPPAAPKINCVIPNGYVALPHATRDSR
ncbi:MAG TPA: hypothetical protein VMI73_29465 [Trebonia sp.]|nr:hypothetical protein [Trebonia sp.]